MDSRVAELLAQIQALGGSGEIDIIAWKDRIVALHSDVEAEGDKVVLIELYSVLMDLAERNIVAGGGDPGPLQNVRKSEHRLFLIKEAMIGENIDPDRLAYLTAREIDAGRMAADDDFNELAVAGSQVLGGQSDAPKPRRGIWQRLFGARDT